MITLPQFQDVLAGALFGGDSAVAGMVIFAATLLVIFAVMKGNMTPALLVAIPVTFVYSALGIVSTELMVIMIVVCVLGLALASKRTLGERCRPTTGTRPSSRGLWCSP